MNGFKRDLAALRGLLWTLAEEQTYADLGRASGLCYSTMARFFSGETKNPSFRTVHGIARAVGMAVTISRSEIRMSLHDAA